MNMSATPSEQQSGTMVAMSLEFDDNSGRLYAVLGDIPENGPALTELAIEDMISSGNYSDLFIYQDIFSDLIRKYESRSHGKILLGEIRDAKISISLEDDRMSAWADYSPAYGGTKLSEEKIKQAIADAKISEKAVVKTAIAEMLACKTANRFLIAKGKLPKKGKDSWIEFLVELGGSNELVENEKGLVDYRESQEYIVVEPGTPLVKRHPATKATFGYDITGFELKTDDGKNISFGKEFTGLTASENDSNVLVAKVKGHPIPKGRGLKVDPSLQFKSVSLATGNVNYDGSVYVTGDVAPDMVIKVTGDVFVKGTVEKAKIEAGASVIVKGGIIGDEPWDVDAEDPPDFSTQVRANGELHARFVNQADIQCKGDIHVREYILNSVTKASNGLFLGQQGGKGVLAGGITRVGHIVEANVIGTDAYICSLVNVGYNPDDLPNFERMKKDRSRRIAEARLLMELLESMRPTKGKEKIGEVELNKARHVKKTLLEIREEVLKIDETLSSYMGDFNTDTENQVSVKKHLYPNSLLTIDGTQQKINEEHNAVTYVRRGSRLVNL